MIPQFPNFKKLVLEDKEEIENFTKQHPPYSDFNFVSLWNWNIKKNTRFSWLNGNLVLQMKDYLKDENIYSFIGKNELESTIEQLFQKIDKLQLIPEVNLSGNSKIFKKYKIKEDINQFDYIYDLKGLAKMEEPKYRKKRNLVRRFLKENKFILKEIDYTTASGSEFINLFKKWAYQKSKSFSDYEHELIAMKNCLALAGESNFLVNGLYINNQKVGFSISEIVQEDYLIMHFNKTLHSYKGITEFFMKEISSYYLTKGGKYLNLMQDLGLENLKRSKKSWGPIKYFKKYTISNIIEK